MEERILFIDCAGSKLIPQINKFLEVTYPNNFFANLRMMGSIYPFLIKDKIYLINEMVRFERDLKTFKDQAVQLIEAQGLNKIVVISEPDCLRYRQLLEYCMIDDFGSQEKAFIEALRRFKIVIHNFVRISSDQILAWYIDEYDDPNNIDFREIQI